MTTMIGNRPEVEPWAGKYIGNRPDALGRPQLVRLETVQFAWGGLIDAEPVGDVIHLNAICAEGDTATLCGIDMFAKDSPGWGRSGGVTGPRYNHVPCLSCREIAHERFPGLAVHPGTFSKLDWSKP